eukprot:6189592-Pleurochrysis_carterae.AAC.1
MELKRLHKARCNCESSRRGDMKISISACGCIVLVYIKSCGILMRNGDSWYLMKGSFQLSLLIRAELHVHKQRFNAQGRYTGALDDGAAVRYPAPTSARLTCVLSRALRQHG